MINLLGLKETIVPQQLEFTVQKEGHWREEQDKSGKIKRKEWDTYPVKIDLKK